MSLSQYNDAIQLKKDIDLHNAAIQNLISSNSQNSNSKTFNFDGLRYLSDFQKLSDMSFLNNMKSEYLLINCAMNMYSKDEYYYSLAERFVNRYVIHYSKVIENAIELHLVDSGINAFVQQLDLSKVSVKKIYIRGNREYKSLIQPGCEKIHLFT